MENIKFDSENVLNNADSSIDLCNGMDKKPKGLK